MIQLRDSWYTYSAYAAAMVLLAWIAFGNLSTHPLDTDDHGFLELASVAQGDLSHLFSRTGDRTIRPLHDLAYVVGYVFWKDNPAPYHKLQVVLHLVCSLLLAFTFRRFGIGLELSLLASLLFLMKCSRYLL